MRLCIAIEKFDPSVGGAERYCWDLAHHLADRGHEVAVICMKAVNPQHESVHVRMVKVIRFPQSLRHLSFALVHYAMARRMPGYVHLGVGNTFFMDIYQPRGGIHRAWLQAESLQYPRLLRRISFWFRRLQLKNLVQEVFEWWIFHVTRPEVIAIADMIKNDIRRLYGYPEGRIHLIPNAIDTGRFNPGNRAHRCRIRARYGLAEDEFIFVFAANNPRLKGFDVLVRACELLPSFPFKVLVVGSGTTWAENRVRRKNLEERFVFAGKVKEMDKLYPACDCLVHPAYYDACSRVVLEALASGIPVITTGANGAKMNINDLNGSAIPAGDHTRLAEAMESFLTTACRQIPPVVFRSQASVFSELEDLFHACAKGKAQGNERSRADCAGE